MNSTTTIQFELYFSSNVYKCIVCLYALLLLYKTNGFPLRDVLVNPCLHPVALEHVIPTFIEFLVSLLSSFGGTRLAGLVIVVRG